MRVELRPVAPDDEALLFETYASTRAEELARTTWNDAQKEAFLRMQFNAQQTDYRSRFPDAEHSVIVVNGAPAGRVYVARDKQAIEILDITILPALRGQGVGTMILRDLCAESSSSAKPLHIYVESYNPSLRLFERLGFSKIEELGLHFLMEWKPEE